jgi:hypothetical protein
LHNYNGAVGKEGKGASDGKFQTKCDKYITGGEKNGIESGDGIKGMWWEI